MTKWQELLKLMGQGEKLFVSIATPHWSSSPLVWTSETRVNFTWAQWKALSHRGFIESVDDEKFWRRTYILTEKGKEAVKKLEVEFVTKESER